MAVGRIRDVLEDATAPLPLSPFVLAELEYPFLARISQRQEDSLLSEVACG